MAETTITVTVTLSGPTDDVDTYAQNFGEAIVPWAQCLTQHPRLWGKMTLSTKHERIATLVDTEPF